MTRNVTKQVAKVTTVKHNTRLNPGPSGCVFQMLWDCESGSGKTRSKAKRTHDSKSGLVSEVCRKNKASEKCHPVSNAVNVYLTKQSNNFSGTIVLQIISALELFTSTEIVELCPVVKFIFWYFTFCFKYTLTLYLQSAIHIFCNKTQNIPQVAMVSWLIYELICLVWFRGKYQFDLIWLQHM